MEPKRFAVIEVKFARKLNEDDLQEIENKLRKFEYINNFSPGLRKITFSIWANKKIDYGIIDELKEFLRGKQQRAPKITSVEYVMANSKTF